MPIRQQIQGRVLVVTLDDPAVKNAFDADAIAELTSIFGGLALREPLPPTAQTDPDVAFDIGPEGRHRPHAVVLRAAGDVFCAGAHLGMMKELGSAGHQENLAAALEMGAMFRAIRDCPVPVVARVQGAAYGGGVGLVASCDVVVAAPQAKFAFSEARLGLVPGVISPLVVDRIGAARARRWFLTAEAFDVVEAHRIGLVDRLVEQHALDAAVCETVDAILQAGPAALGLCKNLVSGVQSLGYARSGELAARLIAEARGTEEAQAALAAFAARAQAPWIPEKKWTLPDLPAAGDE